MVKRMMQSMLNCLPDEAFLKLKYWIRMGKKLDLKAPKTFNEKLQWLKLHDRKPEYTTMVDKAAVKDYVAEKIGSQYIIPTLGIWDRYEDIDFDALPDQFVLKCTHDSGGLVICRDKKTLDREAAKKKIEKSLKSNYYYHGREWPYKNVKPRILAEAYLENGESSGLIDYKFMCFNGEPKCILVCAERSSAEGVKMTFYDTQWNVMEVKRPNPRIGYLVPCPEHFQQMMELSRKLSADIPFLRVDFYEAAGMLRFGEMTFFPASGFGRFEPAQWDETLGSWLALNQ